MAIQMKIGTKIQMRIEMMALLEEAEVDDYRTPRVPSPSDAETLVLGATPDQCVEAHDRDYRTPRVPSPI
eukprot:4905354-Amphidinium_carterae.1